MFEFSTTFTWIAIFAALAAGVNGLGILAIVRYRRWAEKAITYFMCFAAGILISVPLTLVYLMLFKKAPTRDFLLYLDFYSCSSLIQ